MDGCRSSLWEVFRLMKKLWLSASLAIVIAAFLALPSEAQKGKGGGKGNGKGGGKSRPTQVQGKQVESKPAEGRQVESKEVQSKRLPVGEKLPARSFDHPRSGNALPQEVRDRLPPGLRDKPENHPGLANHLRKLGVLQDYPAVDPIPPDVRSQLPPGLRDRPYDHPGVANHLAKLGWSIDEDGMLVPPPTLPPPTVTTPLPPTTLPLNLPPPPFTPPVVTTPTVTTPTLTTPTVTTPTQDAAPFGSFRPFGGFFRRR
jgi:hypothetical protein